MKFNVLFQATGVVVINAKSQAEAEAKAEDLADEQIAERLTTSKSSTWSRRARSLALRPTDVIEETNQPNGSNHEPPDLDRFQTGIPS